MRGASNNPIWTLLCALVGSAAGWTLLLYWPEAAVPAVVFASAVGGVAYGFGFDEGAAERKKRDD